MSHFPVLVIGPDPEAQLQPFHEFECTGTDDQYVLDVDITDEVRAEYERDTLTVYSVDGKDVDDSALFRDPTSAEVARHGPMLGSSYGGGCSWESRDWGDGRGYRAKVWDPESFGATSRGVPCAERMTLAEYVEYSRGEKDIVGPGEEPDLGDSAKYGYMRVDVDGKIVQIIKRTNPNAKWDWWVLGGRWCGFFPVKPDLAMTELAGIKAGQGAGAASGLRPDRGNADQLRVSEVDFATARSEAEAHAHELFDRWERLVAVHGRAKSWTECLDGHQGDRDAAREVYNSQPLVNAADRSREDGGMGFRLGCWIIALGYDRELYVTKQRNAALVPYAVVYNGKWTAKGEMGWWSCSDDKVSEAGWCERVARLYDDLPPDTLLTLVDCHI